MPVCSRGSAGMVFANGPHVPTATTREGGIRDVLIDVASRTECPSDARLCALAQGPHPARLRQDVAAWFYAASRYRPGAAHPALETLRTMMFHAEEWGLRERGTNLCLGIRRNPGRNMARFLDAEELARLGCALDANEVRWPEAVATVRLLAPTSCRRSEVLNLRGCNRGADALNLNDSKTGPHTAVPPGEAAHVLIKVLPDPRDPDAFLFPRHAEGRGV